MCGMSSEVIGKGWCLWLWGHRGDYGQQAASELLFPGALGGRWAWKGAVEARPVGEAFQVPSRSVLSVQTSPGHSGLCLVGF